MKLFGKDTIKKIRRIFPYIFWVGISLLLLLKIFLIVNPFNFLDTYKFMSSDTYDWITNGILLLKSDNISFRNPGLVLLIKVFESLRLLYLLPLFNQVVLFLLIFAVYKITLTLTKKSLLSYLTAFSIFLSYSLQGFSNFILADLWAVLFITLSTLFIIQDKKSLSFFSLGISTLFQNFAFFLFPILFLYVIFSETNIKSILKYVSKNFLNLVKYLILFLNVNIVWFIYKFIEFGSPLYSKVTQFGLLRFHLDSIPFYTINGYSMFGFLFFISILFSIFLIIKNREKRLIIVIALFLFTLFFWILLYDWDDRRFLLYVTPFIYTLSALFFSRIKFKNFVILSIVFLVCIYPSTISLGGVFNGSTLPLTNWYSVKFSSKTSQNKNTKITFPVEKEVKKYPIIAVLNPSYAEFFRNYEKNKFSENTQFHIFETEIETSVNSEGEICLLNRNYDHEDDYSYNNILRIIQYEKCGKTNF